jgi:hypothetical protein
MQMYPLALLNYGSSSETNQKKKFAKVLQRNQAVNWRSVRNVYPLWFQRRIWWKKRIDALPVPDVLEEVCTEGQPCENSAEKPSTAELSQAPSSKQTQEDQKVLTSVLMEFKKWLMEQVENGALNRRSSDAPVKRGRVGWAGWPWIDWESFFEGVLSLFEQYLQVVHPQVTEFPGMTMWKCLSLLMSIL